MIYLKLFHGRDTADEDLEDWGYEGPTLGPFKYMHITYLSDVKFAMEREAFKVAFPEIFADWEAKRYSNAAGYERDGQLWIDHNFESVEDLIKFQGKFYGDFSISTLPA